MMRNLKFLLFCLVAVVVSSCCNNFEQEKALLVKTEWKLTKLKGVSDLQMAEKDSFTLGFDTVEVNIFGKADCNRYFASYKFEEKNEIEFDGVGSTMMMCVNDLTERKYLMMLEEVDTFLIKDSKLILLDDEVVLAEYEPFVK